MFKWIKRIAAVFLTCAIFIAAAAGYAHFIEPELLRVRSFSVETRKDIVPCKIVFFTDTHFGKYYDGSHAEKIVKKINELDADVVIFGGDLFDNYARDRESMDFGAIKNALFEIKASAGKFAVWGNHDYGGGAVRIYKEFITDCGFELLDDESRLLENYGIRIFGYDDYLMGRTDPELYNIKSGAFNLIAAHEPVISEFIESASENLVLSGHTHGGQVRIPFLPIKYFPEGSGKYQKGFYSSEMIKADTQLQMYVSSGVGMTRYPFRFLNVPEIVSIDLTAKEKNTPPAAQGQQARY